jgi:uncharacterized membrane protein YhhN
MHLWVALTGIALLGLLVAEGTRLRPLFLVFKPLASLGFVGLAVAAGALDGGYGRALLVALALAWLGDIFLLGRQSRRLFFAGAGLALLGHVVLAAAFIASEPAWPYAVGMLVVLGMLVGRIYRLLDPHLSEDMRTPVHLYIAVITCMVALAMGAAFGGGHPLMLAGAALLYLSILTVARDWFVYESLTNRLLGLPLYYAGQLCLAWTPSL